ncbi:MAG: CDP-glycerol glycerophosphotransferase family protein [Micropruina sp.]|uniref:CDP-glycerol glycerophosphotransferase family protein n=1 Tax=Micropruina sp. TaxID=2737536 RepID=UPI0039E5A7D9
MHAAPRFDFARGNLHKLLAAPRYLAGMLRARTAVRDPSLWVVGSAFGLADGALAFARAARQLPSPPRLVWLASDSDEVAAARREGFEAYLKSGDEGFHLTLHAGLILVTHGFGDVNRFGADGAVTVQLWHGAPLKKVQADSPAVFGAGLGRIPGMGALMRWAYRRSNSRISLLPTSSAVFQPSLISAFTLDESRVRVLGEPRSDLLFIGPVADRIAASRATLASHLGDLGDRRVLLYAPTWRNGEPDPAIPSDAEWRLIDALCERHDCLLVVRPHRLGVGDYTYVSERVRLLPASVQMESMPLLWGLSALITDYSSMLVDYVVTGQPLVLLAPDLEHYRATRGLYIDYEELAGGRWYRTWTEVIERLDALLGDPEQLAAAQAHSRALAERFQTYTDGRNAERVAAAAAELVTQRFT